MENEMKKDLDKLKKIQSESTDQDQGPESGPGPGAGPGAGPVFGDFVQAQRLYPAVNLFWKGYGNLTKTNFTKDEIQASTETAWELIADIPVVAQNAKWVGFAIVHLFMISKPLGNIFEKKVEKENDHAGTDQAKSQPAK